MITLLLVCWVRPPQPLGYVAIVKGKVRLYHVSAHRSKMLPPGHCRRPVWLYPTDRIEIEGEGTVQGMYDDKVLLLFGPKSWPAPEKGIFGGGKAARSLMARRQLNPDGPSKLAIGAPDRLDLWPPAAKTTPWLYVDSEGVFALAWVAPKRATTVTVTATIEGKKVGCCTAPAHRNGVHSCPFGWIEDMSLGLKLRQRAREDELTPVTIDLRTDSGQTRTIQCELVLLGKARQWDGLVSSLHAALDAHQGAVETGWFEPWNDLLESVEDAAPALRGYWILKVWSVYPDAFVTRDAVRQLAEESGLIDIATRFSK